MHLLSASLGFVRIEKWLHSVVTSEARVDSFSLLKTTLILMVVVVTVAAILGSTGVSKNFSDIAVM